jgi:hypothetical protein
MWGRIGHVWSPRSLAQRAYDDVIYFVILGSITPKVVGQIRTVGAGGWSRANTFVTIRSVTLRNELQIDMKDRIISYHQMCNAGDKNGTFNNIQGRISS